MSKFILKPIFKVFLLFGVSFWCRINLDNCALLVCCVDWMKMKFTISLSELWIDHFFLLLDESFISARIFFCWAYGGFYWPELTASFVAKKFNNTASRPKTLFFEEDCIPKPQIACSRLIVSTSNNKKPCKKKRLNLRTNGPILLKPLAEEKTAQSQRRINKSLQSKRNEPDRGFCSCWEKKQKRVNQIWADINCQIFNKIHSYMLYLNIYILI